MLYCLKNPSINWTWFLVVENENDGQIRIHNHFRVHNTRDSFRPQTIGEFEIIEDENRNAVKVVIKRDGWVNKRTVVNPKHVFDYTGKPV